MEFRDVLHVMHSRFPGNLFHDFVALQSIALTLSQMPTLGAACGQPIGSLEAPDRPAVRRALTAPCLSGPSC